MSVRLKISSRTGLYLSIPLMAGFAVSATYAFAQYAQMANNNAPSGMARTATIQECAQACAANMACGSFVYYTQNAMANVCQLTSSQTPMNIVGAISGVPFRKQQPIAQQQTNQQPATNASPLRKTSETTPTNFQNQAHGQGNYAVSPVAYGQSANNPNWSLKPAYQPQQTSQSGAISFVRPENVVQQKSQLQKYNPQPQSQTLPVTQVQTYTPAATNQMQMVSQQQAQNLRPVPAQQQQYYSAAQVHNSANDVNYQSHSQQPIPEYSVARATQQASQQSIPQNTETVVDKPVREANLGPLRPPVKTQLEYDKYRDKDGMVDAAAMRRDMLKNEQSPRYSVESEWAGIAQNTEANQAAKIFENSAPVPLPAEISEKDLLTEDKANTETNTPKKKSLFSKVFKRELDEYAEPANEDTLVNNQNDGPLRRK